MPKREKVSLVNTVQIHDRNELYSKAPLERIKWPSARKDKIVFLISHDSCRTATALDNLQ